MTNLIRALGLPALILVVLLFGHRAAEAESRFALVIGNDQYKTARLATPANDAGLIAATLQAAGFTVTGARNLDQATLRELFREFVAQVSAAGPDSVALVYLAGFALQFNGDNYFVPVDADIGRDVDVPLQAVRISDFTQALAALPGRVKIVVLDGARQNPFARRGDPLASGLALVDPVPTLAMAFNAAPGTVGPDELGPYGAYATAFAEMIAAGGLSLDDVFAQSPVARQRSHPGRRNTLVCVADRRPVLHDGAGCGCTAAAERDGAGRYPQPAGTLFQERRRGVCRRAGGRQS